MFRCGLWASSGPFPLSAHYGLYKRGRDHTTNPSRHLKKKGVFSLSSGCSRKIKEGDIKPPPPPPPPSHNHVPPSCPPPRPPPPLALITSYPTQSSLRRRRRRIAVPPPYPLHGPLCISPPPPFPFPGHPSSCPSQHIMSVSIPLHMNSPPSSLNTPCPPWFPPSSSLPSAILCLPPEIPIFPTRTAHLLLGKPLKNSLLLNASTEPTLLPDNMHL